MKANPVRPESQGEQESDPTHGHIVEIFTNGFMVLHLSSLIKGLSISQQSGLGVFKKRRMVKLHQLPLNGRKLL